MAYDAEHDEKGRPPAAPNMWTIWLEAPITRRKKYHILTDPAGEQRFASMSFTEVLQYLEDEDISLWRICSRTKTWGVVRQYCLPVGEH